jgi:hypothetical protein
MKYLLLTLSFFLIPYSALAFSYERTPSGNDVGESVEINVTFDETDLDEGIWDDATFWCIALEGVDIPTQYGTQTPKPALEFSNTGTQTFSLPTDTEILIVTTYGMIDDSECSNVNTANGGYLTLEGDGNSTIFTFSETQVSGFFTMVEQGDLVSETVTGENMQASVSYAGNTFYKPFMGAGLALLFYLRYWIVALIIIGLITFFYRRYKLLKT